MSSVFNYVFLFFIDFYWGVFNYYFFLQERQYNLLFIIIRPNNIDELGTFKRLIIVMKQVSD